MMRIGPPFSPLSRAQHSPCRSKQSVVEVFSLVKTRTATTAHATTASQRRFLCAHAPALLARPRQASERRTILRLRSAASAHYGKHLDPELEVGLFVMSARHRSSVMAGSKREVALADFEGWDALGDVGLVGADRGVFGVGLKLAAEDGGVDNRITAFAET